MRRRASSISAARTRRGRRKRWMARTYPRWTPPALRALAVVPVAEVAVVAVV
jgi:hypothetical protein